MIVPIKWKFFAEASGKKLRTTIEVEALTKAEANALFDTTPRLEFQGRTTVVETDLDPYMVWPNTIERISKKVPLWELEFN